MKDTKGELILVDEVKPYTPRELSVTITSKDLASRLYMTTHRLTLEDIATGRVKVVDNG
jgi:hypothetical protein